MATSSGMKETFYAPEPQESAEIFDFISAHTSAHTAKIGTQPDPHFYLSGSESGEQVELPQDIYKVLIAVVDAMQRGMAVTVTPHTMTLTTQQAAEILGISRPTLISLLDEGRIPFERPKNHRRLRLEDVMDYKESRRMEQYAALDRMGAVEDEDPQDIAERMRRARREAGKRRRAQPA